MTSSFWTEQADLVRRVLRDPQPIGIDELLVPRDLGGQLARQMQPPPGITPRESAVLLLLYPHQDELWLPLTVRSSRLTTHRGEVSLPGGGADPADPTPHHTALREAEEEIGVDPALVKVIGTLSSFYIPPSNNRLTPVVGLSRETPTLQADPEEVEAVFSVPLRQLLDPATVQVELWERRDIRMHVPFFLLEGHKVWGATAILLSELVVRLRRGMVRDEG